MNNLPIISTVWIGNKLNQIACACLKSFVKKGHTVHLYTYDFIENIPKDVVICDGNEIIPKSRIIKHKKKQEVMLCLLIFFAISC